MLRPGDSVTFSNMALPSLRLAPDASRASRPALLVQHNAESEPELFPLLKPHTAVGRGLAADLRLDQAFISSRQCAIELRSPAIEARGDPAIEVTPAPPLANRGQSPSGAQSSTAPAALPPSVPAPLPPSVWLTDESRFGTFVNGQRATGRTELHHGDQVSFGGEPPYPLLTLWLDLDLDLDAQIAGEIVEEVAPLGPAGEDTRRPAKRPRTPTKVTSTKDALPSSERQAATVRRRESQAEEGVATVAAAAAAAVAAAAVAAEAAEAVVKAEAVEPSASRARGSASVQATQTHVGAEGTVPRAQGTLAEEEAEEDTDVYEVDLILGERRRGGRAQFLIRWLGFGASHDSWEAQGNVCADLVAAFRKERRLQASVAAAAQRTAPKGVAQCTGRRDRDGESGHPGAMPPARPEGIEQQAVGVGAVGVGLWQGEREYMEDRHRVIVDLGHALQGTR